LGVHGFPFLKCPEKHPNRSLVGEESFSEVQLPLEIVRKGV
jgi:hypothetical protein